MPDTPMPPQVVYAPAPAPAPAADPVLLEMDNLPPPGEGAPQRIPYSRFHAQVQARRAVEAQLQELRAELDTARATVQDWEQKGEALTGWESERETLQQQHAAELARVAEGYELRALGFESEDLVEAARWAYDRTPEEGRPSFVEALKLWKSDPEQAPAILRPHLQAPAPAPSEAPEQPPAPKGYQWPNPNKGASTRPPAPGQKPVADQAKVLELRRSGKSMQWIYDNYRRV